MPQFVEQAVRERPYLLRYRTLGARHAYEGRETLPEKVLNALGEAVKYLYLDGVARGAVNQTKH